MKQQHILIFDSGIGGLSIYREIVKLQPHVRYTYIFDNEAYPYGELQEHDLINRVSGYISQFTKMFDVDLIVIACNSASTVALPTLREKLSIPVVGVVPAIKPAAKISKRAIGLIATPATIKRPYTAELIKTFAPNREVKMVGTTRLVNMAEDKLRGKEINLAELKEILLPDLLEIDVAVLGCTHFPWLKKEIAHVLGPEVTLVDSGLAIANRVIDLLGKASEQEETVTKEVFCSAPPIKVDALNLGLEQLGFSKVTVMPFQGA
jgi:glutamate racemase